MCRKTDNDIKAETENINANQEHAHGKIHAKKTDDDDETLLLPPLCF